MAAILTYRQHRKLSAQRATVRLKERRPFRGPCFELTYSEYQQVAYEEIFYLMKENNFSFTEAYNLPVGLRKWFVKKTTEYNNPEEDE